MEIRELTVERRDAAGKGAAKRLRRQGRVPAILYGARTEPLPLSVAPKDLQRLVASTPVGTHVRLGVLRNGQAEEVEVTVGAYRETPLGR